MQAHKITIPKTAHYYTLGQPGKHIRKLWIVCHGYGQLASTFIYKFEGLDDGQTLVLAPEGLSRFYWGGLTGPVVASWMTKHDRLDEIVDYSNFLQQLYDLTVPQLAEDVQITLLGFSQGCATQCRWILNKLPHFHQLILWAGLLPEDVDYKIHQAYFSDKKLTFVYGKQDEFVTEERLFWQRDFAAEQGLEFDTVVFEGKHEVDRAVLQQLAAQSNTTQ